MATINLLPWREERREELKKEFLMILGGFAAVGAVIVLLWQFLLSGDIDYQKSRNNFLQQRIKELDAQVKEIKSHKSKKDQLIARMQVIQSLQGNRPQIVHIFDELCSLEICFYDSSVWKSNSIQFLYFFQRFTRVSTNHDS